MQFTFLGHSCFIIEISNKKLLFDPFITPNPLAASINVSNITADYIIISHGHQDHIADAVSLALQTNATVITNWEIADWLQKQGVTKVHPMNTGGSFNFDFGTIKAVVAQHSSSLPDGSYGGNPLGFVINNDEESFYYSGDTALTFDMQLIASYKKLNFAVMPIGNNFTMGVNDAITASKFIQCNNIIGVHYNTFGYIVIDKEKAIQAFKSADKTLFLPQIGETIILK